MTNETITTERLLLRQPMPDDLPAWDGFFLSERARYVGGGESASPEQSWRIFAIFLGHWPLRGTGPYVIEAAGDGRAIGMAGPWFPRGWPEAELTWSLWHAEHEGQGYAREAVRAVRRHVVDKLGWPRVVSYVDPANEASIRLCKALGCTEDPSLPVPDDDGTLAFLHPTA